MQLLPSFPFPLLKERGRVYQNCVTRPSRPINHPWDKHKTVQPPSSGFCFMSSSCFLDEGSKGFSPLIHHPSAKNVNPARAALPQARPYHVAYIRTAAFQCSLRVAGSGFTASGGFTAGGNLYSLNSGGVSDGDDENALNKNFGGNREMEGVKPVARSNPAR